MEFVDDPAGFIASDTLEGGSVRTTYLPTVTYEVYVASKKASKQKVLLSTAKSIKASTAGELQTYKVELQKVKLEALASQDKNSSFIKTASVATYIVTAIVIVWALCLVFKLIRRIRKEEIFVTQVSKYLEITGILLVILYLYQWITSYALTQYCINNIQLTDYYVVYKNDANSMYIITGLALMIISQIILMGKDLKEEQELTI